MSVLSVRTQGLLDEKKVENNPATGTDKTDKPINERPLSVLSVRSTGLLDENLVNMPEPDISDKPDRFKWRANMSPDEEGLVSVLSVPLKGPFSETSFYPLDATSLSLMSSKNALRSTEYDGQQTSTQAERIAYLDAFLAVLVTLLYENVEDDWLD